MVKSKYRSGLEELIVPPLLKKGALYEPVSLRFTPRRPKSYTPDVVLPNGIAVEIKGWFKPSDRTKLLDVKAAFPVLDLRLVLQAPHARIARGSDTTSAAWCDTHGFAWASGNVPASWFKEPLKPASVAILMTAHQRKMALNSRRRNRR